MEEKELIIDGKRLKLLIEWFDENIDLDHGATYHGFSYKVEGDGFQLWFKKYDDDEEVGFVSEPEIGHELTKTIIKKALNESVRIYSLKEVN